MENLVYLRESNTLLTSLELRGGDLVRLMELPHKDVLGWV